MKVQYTLFPEGRTKAMTFSYDDGRTQDRLLVSKLNKYGFKGTFHLNSGFLGREGYITAEEVRTLFQGHEVSAHTVSHPFLEISPPDQVAHEILEDRRTLESLVQYPVHGMSYPFGTYNDKVVAMLPALGIEYARTVNSHGRFDMPADPLRWHPTCHHKQLLEQVEIFRDYQERFKRMSLLYVWGHSYEFDNDDNWEIIDQAGELLKDNDTIWHATNAEIIAYMQALERLRFSVDRSIVHNPSALDVWISVDDKPIKISAGQVIQL
ncbi:polysaccharide deacetylase [Paenibacillus sp. FSL A5-0031]|uniref:polysaccharide deacetylase family protein n=1 Tax=Paenibacillus sp. FSL A5-0031 TaxID=1920420 RepID=UPI00096E022E|nr:polysaccharide deacetylase family protein [Paenibacillus sp. FSL A5-0031]OME86036.1 polysaccharide deacetylase [Paenibacillus sp. FSL A5-0031]